VVATLVFYIEQKKIIP